MVEDRWKLARRQGLIAKHLRNPVIVQDKPWDGQLGAYPSVLFDEQMGKYRMWYDCFSLTNYYARHLGPAYYIGYAESDDAFNWTKPLLQGFPFGRYPRTNIVTAGRKGTRAAGAQVQLNPDQSDPARRFIMVYIHWGQMTSPIPRTGCTGTLSKNRCSSFTAISPTISSGFPNAVSGTSTSVPPSGRRARVGPFRKASGTPGAGLRLPPART